MLQIHPAVFTEANTFCHQQTALSCPAWGSTACMVYHPVAGVGAVIFRLTEHFAHQSGVFLPPDEAGDLAIGSHSACRDLLHDGKDLVNNILVHALLWARRRLSTETKRTWLSSFLPLAAASANSSRSTFGAAVFV